MDYPGKVITKTQVTPTQTSASGNWTLDDQAAAIKNNNWPVALVPNPISKSLRFNSADSAYLNRTVAAAATSNTLTTLSFWFKRAKLGTSQQLFASATSAPNVACYVELTTSDTLKIYLDMTAGGSDETTWTTSAVFRDVSAWYGATIKVDTSQASNANKVLLYINGVSQTLTASQTGTAVSTQRILENGISLTIGKYFNSSGYGDFYLTEFNCIDGQALDASSFGLTNPQTGQWIPKKYTGTYGTNGFYLNFKDATSTTTLGYDYSGNANNWTTNNFSVTAGSGNDSLTDVPTPWVAYNTTGDVGGVVRGNYCTLNPLQKNSTVTIANGNLDITTSSDNREVLATLSASAGKWYFEVTFTSQTNTEYIGICDTTYTLFDGSWGSQVRAYISNGNKWNGSSSAYGASYTTNDVIGVAYDIDAGTIVFYKNNSSQGTAFTDLNGKSWRPFINNGVSNAVSCNFGQRPFAYTPPAGFRSLCTTNLPATTIGFGLTNQGGNYFNPVLYTGTGSSLGVTGVGFQPDWVWIKGRSGATDHGLYDAVRGVQNQVESNSTGAETVEATGLTAFGADGFTVGALAQLNTSSATYVAWNWKAGGTGVTNTAGTITSTVSANTTAGFSIVTYTGVGNAGDTVGHGLGVAPSMIIIKWRTGGTTQDWIVYHASIGATKFLELSTTDAEAISSTRFNDTAPSSTVFTLGTNSTVNASTYTYVAYCFAAVAGYSAFGSYTGNNSNDGPFVYLGFRPAFVLIKATNTTQWWTLLDNKRDTYNVATLGISPNSSDSETTFNTNRGPHNIDFTSNGFKIRTSSSGINGTNTFIYAAFAEYPFQFANAR